MTDRSVTPITKDSQLYPVGRRCPKGVATCTQTAPCPSCLGRRNRRKGREKQRAAQKALGIPMTRFRTANGHEESWQGHVRAEAKAGKQVGPAWTRYLASEEQSEATRPIGDTRPFVSLLMPDGVTDGLIQFRISKARAVVDALLEMWGDM